MKGQETDMYELQMKYCSASLIYYPSTLNIGYPAECIIGSKDFSLKTSLDDLKYDITCQSDSLFKQRFCASQLSHQSRTQVPARTGYVEIPAPGFR